MKNKLTNNEERVETYNSLRSNFSTNSFVVYTLTNDCLFKCGSFDHINVLSDNANARYGESSGSSNAFLASLIKFLYSEDLQNVILPSTSFILISNSYLDKLD